MLGLSTAGAEPAWARVAFDPAAKVCAAAAEFAKRKARRAFLSSERGPEPLS